MKLKDYNKKIKSLSDKELFSESENLNKDLLNYRFKISVNNFGKVRDYRVCKRNLARIKTEFRNRKLSNTNK